MKKHDRLFIVYLTAAVVTFCKFGFSSVAAIAAFVIFMLLTGIYANLEDK